ncbi:rootletin-like [Salmo salar]|uniref:Rootletin-like n=1 Tax=Salmo salar TaxID=8030 RepID=A0ABM3EAT1_SALSA|nr:rootletin-like [Salmo salar]
MESALLDGWKEERAELRAELSRMQNELAESHAEREELESRAQALTDRLSQSLDPSLSLPLHLDSELRRKMRDGREREARQALLIHKLQNKVLEYRDRCQGLENHVKTEERELLNRERRIRDEHSDSLEGALIRLEEEQQRSVGLAELNSLLRGQLSQSGQVNEALREDLCKLTTDWSKAVEEAGLREMEWQKEEERLTGHVDRGQSRLMFIWGDVVTLRRHCHTMKTATDRDLWELRAEFSRLSSSLLSHCGSVVSLSLRPSDPTTSLRPAAARSASAPTPLLRRGAHLLSPPP